MPAPAYRHRVRSRTPPRAAGSADTADARKPGRTIPYCRGRPRIGVRCRHWLPARTSPRRAPRNGDRRIFPPHPFSIPGPCCVSVRSEARLQLLCIMYTRPTGKARGPAQEGAAVQQNVRAAETPARKDAINRPPASAVRPLRLGYRQRRVGAVQELDRGEHQLGIADVLEIVHLELAVAVGLVPGLAGPIGVLDGRAVLQVLPSASRRDRRPEIIKHVAMKSDPFAAFQ